MTDTTITSASSTNTDAYVHTNSPAHKHRSGDLARVWNERVDKIRRMREDYESLRQRRLRQLLEAERAAQELRDRLTEQRRQRREEARKKEDERRTAVEERRRHLEAEEKSKLEEALRRMADRESRFDSLKRRMGQNEKYAFGSSLPRDFGSLFGSASASASASRAESDYEDNGGSLKASRCGSPRRDPSRKERRAQSTGANNRRTYEPLPLSLAPDGCSYGDDYGNMHLSKMADGISKSAKNATMSTSMLVEYHSSLMPVGQESDVPVAASAGRYRRARERVRTAGSGSTSASPHHRHLMPPVDSSSSATAAICSPHRSRLRAPTYNTTRTDDRSFVTLSSDSQVRAASNYSDDPTSRTSGRGGQSRSNGETGGDSGADRHGSPRVSRLRRPQTQAQSQIRPTSPSKSLTSSLIVSKSNTASAGTGSSRVYKQSTTSPSRIPLRPSSKLERSLSAGPSDTGRPTSSRTAGAGAGGQRSTGIPKPKPSRPRSADADRRNRLPASSEESSKPAATGSKTSSSYAEWKAKVSSNSGGNAMKDSISLSTPKRGGSPSKLPQSLRSKPSNATAASSGSGNAGGSNTESHSQPSSQQVVVVRGRTKSPIKGAGVSATSGQSQSQMNVAATGAAIISIIKTPPITQCLADSPPPLPPPPSVQSQPQYQTDSNIFQQLLSNRSGMPTVGGGSQEQDESKPLSSAAAAAAAVAVASSSVSEATTNTAVTNANASADANGNGNQGWSQLEQMLLAKRSDQLEEEWQKMKSDEEKKQQDLTDREQALKAREAQLAELEKERLARKERLKNIMTRVRPGAEGEDAATAAAAALVQSDGNRAQSMCTLNDLRSQQLGLFNSASSAGPSTSSVLDSALRREAARSAATNAIALPPSCAEVEFAGAWAPSRRVMFAQAPLVLGVGGTPQPATAPLTIPRGSGIGGGGTTVSSILRSSRASTGLQPLGGVELSSSAPPAVGGGLSALGGLMQLRRQVEAATNGIRSGNPPPPAPPGSSA